MPTHLLLCFCDCGLNLLAKLTSEMLDIIRIKYAIAVVIAVQVYLVTQRMSVDQCNSKVDVEKGKVEHENKLKIAVMEERENRLMQDNNHLKELNKISSKSVTECQERLRASQQRDQGYMDCASEIVAYRNKYEECRDELGKQQVEHLETLIETLQKHMKDQHDASKENKDIKDHQIQELQRQRREQFKLDSISEATHEKLDNLKAKLLRLAEKKCKGFFGTKSDDLEVEQREVVKYALSLKNLNGLDVDGGLRLLFKDPCSVDITMIDLLVTLWKTKTTHRKYQGILSILTEAPGLT